MIFSMISHVEAQPQDLFSTNFLVDWQPESLLSMEVAISKPRVYIIDFEFAIEFSPNCPVEDRVCTGYPLARWYPQEEYLRPYPDELDEDKPWCPFKLDLWQLAYTFTHRIEVCIFYLCTCQYLQLIVSY